MSVRKLKKWWDVKNVKEKYIKIALISCCSRLSAAFTIIITFCVSPPSHNAAIKYSQRQDWEIFQIIHLLPR